MSNVLYILVICCKIFWWSKDVILFCNKINVFWFCFFVSILFWVLKLWCAQNLYRSVKVNMKCHLYIHAIRVFQIAFQFRGNGNFAEKDFVYLDVGMWQRMNLIIQPFCDTKHYISYMIKQQWLQQWLSLYRL